MTEECKKKILEWVCGKFDLQVGNDTPQFEKADIISNNLEKYIWDNFFLNNSKPNISGIVRGRSNNGEFLDSYALYGMCIDENSKQQGFVIILDNKFNPVQSITKFSSDVKIGYLQKLDVDEEGNFYALETPYDNSRDRFLMLNNLLLKGTTQSTYQLKIRKSYTIPTDVTMPDTLVKIIKQYGGSRYLFCGTYNAKERVVDLKVNVGSENEWKTLVDSGEASILMLDAYADFIDDEVSIKIIGSNKYKFFLIVNSGNTLIRQWAFSFGETADTFRSAKATILNSSTGWMIMDSQTDEYRITIAKIENLYNPKVKYRAIVGEGAKYDNAVFSNIVSDGINTYVFFNAPQDTNYEKYKYYQGIIYSDEVFLNEIGEFSASQISNFTMQTVFNSFNLYLYLCQVGNNAYITKQIFNVNNYNGKGYNAVNALIPNSGVLYDSDNSPIFARNLYNKTVRGSTTISTIEVPNTQLNDVSISKNNLIGQTNFILNSKTNTVSKNIYETLNINFINTMIMKNSNGEENDQLNTEGAIKINKSISELADYENSKLSKYKINYSDDSSSIVSIDSSQISIQNNVATVNILVYNPQEKSINNIDLISNDETVSYLNIDCSAMVNDKCYLINQKVEIY